MKERKRRRGNDKWKRVEKDKRDRRREGMEGGRVNEKNNIHYPTLRTKTNTF